MGEPEAGPDCAMIVGMPGRMRLAKVVPFTKSRISRRCRATLPAVSVASVETKNSGGKDPKATALDPFYN